jgi:hypothetical protein
MTHSDLVARAERWLLKNRGCGFALTELVSYAGEIPDAIGWQHSCSHLVECKLTRSDFLSDARKRFRRNPLQGMGNYRYYLSPPDVISETDLPDRWGLLWVWPKRVVIVRNAQCFSDPQIAANERYLFYSALRRVHLRGDLSKIYEDLT